MVKVFMGWSGDESREITIALKEIFEITLNEGIKFFMSEDILTGHVWFNKIQKELSECQYGLFVITHTNSKAPWILFEAGALSNGVNNKVSLCLTSKEIDIVSPLDAFQRIVIDEDSIRKIIFEIKTLECGDINNITVIKRDLINKIFSQAWTNFEKRYKEIINRYKLKAFDHRHFKDYRNPNYDYIVSSKDFYSTENSSTLSFEYHKKALSYEVPREHFVMQAFCFGDLQDWTSYIDGDYILKFNIDIINMSHVTLEVKTGYQRDIAINKAIDMNQKLVEIKLSQLTQEEKRKLKQVNEICFTVFYPAMSEGSCRYTISNLRLER